MAKKTDIQLFIGTDFALQFVVLNAAETAVIDTSAWSMSFMLKVDPRDDDSDAVLTTANIEVTGAYDATITENTQLTSVNLEDTDTDDLVPGRYFWELKRTDDGGETVIAYGTAELIKGVHG